MRILEIIPAPPERGGLLATFSIELPNGVRIFDLSLHRAKDGALRTWAPHIGRRRSVTFSPALAESLSRAALAALEGADAQTLRSY